MIIRVRYPSRLILNANAENVDRELSRLGAAMVVTNRDRTLQSCRVKVLFNTTACVKGIPLKRNYFTDAELKYICEKIFRKYFKRLQVQTWTIKELPARFNPELFIKVLPDEINI